MIDQRRPRGTCTRCGCTLYDIHDNEHGWIRCDTLTQHYDANACIMALQGKISDIESRLAQLERGPILR